MIRLDTTMRKLQLGFDSTVSGGAAVVVSFYNYNLDKGISSGGNQLTAAGASIDGDICGVPLTGFVKYIDSVTIINLDSATHVATVKIDDNGTDYILVRQSLAQNETLVYEQGDGWSVI